MAAFLNRLTTQPDSASPSVGTITKPGGVFLHNAGIDNTFLGVGAGNFQTSTSANVGIGARSLAANQGGRNVGIGADSLANNTTGSLNVAVGGLALKANTTGLGNTAVGDAALLSNDVGTLNTAVGLIALGSNYNGQRNSALGYEAMGINFSGDFNTAVGASALYSNVSGSSNTAVGSGALFGNKIGQNNIPIGAGTGRNAVTGSWNIALGNAGAEDDSNPIRIGDTVMHMRAFVAGIRGTTTGANDAVNVVIDSNGQLGTISSSKEAKLDITDMRDASDALMLLRPVTFHYRADSDPAGPRLQYGLIAEEVAEVYPGMVATKDGKPETILYQYLSPMLLNELQKQQRTIQAQAKEIERQRVEIAEVKASHAREIADLRRAVEVLMARTSNEDRVAAR